MELVQQAMRERCDHERRDSDKGEAGKKRVEGREYLRSVGTERIDRPHSTKDHRCVQQRIDPTQFRDAMISKNADAQGEGDRNQRD